MSHLACQCDLDVRSSFTCFRSSIPDVERFLQEPLYQCSHQRASAYVGGPNLLTLGSGSLLVIHGKCAE